MKIRQNMHNFVPEKVAPRKIGIIGGRGAMGHLLAEEFHKDGYEVLVTGEEPSRYIEGRNLKKLNRNIVKEVDVVIFSVPIRVIQRGIKEILGDGAPRGLRNKLFLDISSTKLAPIEKMKEIKGPTIIGTHPMFGPRVYDFRGQTVFVSPIKQGHYVLDQRLGKWLTWVERFWEKRGANIVRITPDDHDKVVPIVQFAVLACSMLYASVLGQMEVDQQFIQDIATPNSRLLHALVGRSLRDSTVELYSNLITENEHNLDIAKIIKNGAKDIYDLVKSKDYRKAHQFLSKLSNNQKRNYKDKGLDTSNFIQRCIANRKKIEEFLEQTV